MSKLILQPGDHRRLLREFVENTKGTIRIASAYVTDTALLKDNETRVRLLTSFDAMDLISGATSLDSLANLLERGVQCRLVERIPKLHAKVYIFADGSAVITSANLTGNALDSNIEVGHQFSGDAVTGLSRWFDTIWHGGRQLAASDVESWKKKIAPLRARWDQARSELLKLTSELLTGRPAEGIGDLFTGTRRFFYFNTNRRNEKPTANGRWKLEEEMRVRGCAVVWTTFKSERDMKSVQPGDVILAFAKGVGVIGVGVAKSGPTILRIDAAESIYRLRTPIARDVTPNKREWRIDVDWLEWKRDSDACPLNRDVRGISQQPPNASFLDVTDGWIPEKVRKHFLRT